MRKLIKKIIHEFSLERYRDHKKQIQISLNSGDKVFCPLCNSKFRKFKPYGVVKRKNAKCYFCGSMERHRLLSKYLNERTDLFNNNEKIRLLHFAPEKPFYDIFSIKQNIEYIPCDLSPDKYAYNGKVKITQADITNIPFKEDHFDVVLCNHVLEHIPDDRLAMSELYRVMKNGAWGIFQVPIDYNRANTYEDFTITKPKKREKAFGQNDHVRWYGRDYKNRLEKVGFDVKEDDYVKSFSADELFKFGLIDTELIYFCRK